MLTTLDVDDSLRLTLTKRLSFSLTLKREPVGSESALNSC